MGYSINGRSGANANIQENIETAAQAKVVADALTRWTQRAYPPARMTADQVADCLGFHPDDIPVFVRERLLTPLGNPRNNAIKYFLSDDVEAFGNDREKLNRAQDLLYGRNQAKIAMQTAA